MSLADFVDASGPDGVAITVETDDTGDIHPAVYVRRHGRVDTDDVLDASPLHDYRTDEHRRSAHGDLHRRTSCAGHSTAARPAGRRAVAP